MPGTTEARATEATDGTASGSEPASETTTTTRPTDGEARLIKDIGKLKERMRAITGERNAATERAETAERTAASADELKSVAMDATRLSETTATELTSLRGSLQAAQASIQTYYDSIVSDLPESEQALWNEMPGTVEQKFALLGKHKGIIKPPDTEPATIPVPPNQTGVGVSMKGRRSAELQQLKDRARAGDKQARNRWEELIIGERVAAAGGNNKRK